MVLGMTNTELDRNVLTVLPRWARTGTVVFCTAGALVAGTGLASADTVEVPLGEHAYMSEQYGSGEAWASNDGLAVRINATVTDTRSDSRCAYVHYKIKAPGWFDPDGKVVRVCGNGRSDSGYVDWVGPSWSWARTAEVKVCREQGLGADPCGPTQVLDL